nr:hypothetical protein [Heyndrickxia sporothermodurans]
MRCLNGGLLVNYHYTRFGEVLLFLSLKPLDTQGLRIMKFIQLNKNHETPTAPVYVNIYLIEILTVRNDLKPFQRLVEAFHFLIRINA